MACRWAEITAAPLLSPVYVCETDTRVAAADRQPLLLCLSHLLSAAQTARSSATQHRKRYESTVGRLMSDRPADELAPAERCILLSLSWVESLRRKQSDTIGESAAWVA